MLMARLLYAALLVGGAECLSQGPPIDPRTNKPPLSYTGQFEHRKHEPITLTPIGWIESPVRDVASAQQMYVTLTLARFAPLAVQRAFRHATPADGQGANCGAR